MQEQNSLGWAQPQLPLGVVSLAEGAEPGSRVVATLRVWDKTLLQTRRVLPEAKAEASPSEKSGHSTVTVHAGRTPGNSESHTHTQGKVRPHKEKTPG